MATTTMGFGGALVALGLVSYALTGGASVTALIPAIFGLLLLLLGWLAQREAWRRHAMHAAVLVGLLGFLGSIPGLLSLPALLGGGEIARPAAVLAQSAMAVLMAVFVGLGVKSFVEARRARRSGS